MKTLAKHFGLAVQP